MHTVVLDLYGEIPSMAEFKPFLYPLLSSGELKMFWEERNSEKPVNYELSYRKLLQHLRRLSASNWHLIIMLGVSEDTSCYDENENLCTGSLADQITKIQNYLLARLSGKLAPMRVSYIVVDPIRRQGHTNAPIDKLDKSYLHWEMDTCGYTSLNNIPCTFRKQDIDDLEELKTEIDFSKETTSEGFGGLSSELQNKLTACCERYIECVSSAVCRVALEWEDQPAGNRVNMYSRDKEYLSVKKALTLSSNFEETLWSRIQLDPESVNSIRPEIIFKELLYDYYSVSGIINERSCCVRVRQADFSAPRHDSIQFRVGIVILLLLEIGEDDNMLGPKSFLSLGNNIDVNIELAGNMIDHYLHALEAAKDSVKIDSTRAIQGSFTLQRTPEVHFEEPKPVELPAPPATIYFKDWNNWWEDVNSSLSHERDQYKKLDRENVFLLKRANKSIEIVDIDNIEAALDQFKEDRETMKKVVANKDYLDFNITWKRDTQDLIDKLKYRTEIFSGVRLLFSYGTILTVFVLLMLFLGGGGGYLYYMLGWGMLSLLIMGICSLGAKLKLKRVQNELKKIASSHKKYLSDILKGNKEHLKKQCEFSAVANNYRKLFKEVNHELRRKSLILYHANKVADHIELMRPLADLWKADEPILNSNEFADEIFYDRPVVDNLIYSPSTFIPDAASYSLEVKHGLTNPSVTYFPFKLVALEEDGMFEGGRKDV
ncbi:hypothetical protein SAMN06295933_2046 [Desulfovibrio gilichinskyi]|uniref:Uncharacterized protein n=1 Tax=Desulfovibrio gilichinskyi TaxID=1519643 RepID=A0A1X7DM16_9BACT|nr:hypothetical protein SAMN06295933_2046 [Desulfovibrio gilichinskyi]